jgi:phage/plasmid-associated DNA primase
LDFGKYKNRLKEYLRCRGVDTGKDPTHCFNKSAHKHGDANPSLQLFDENFKCHGCGIEGDIYDAAGLLEGISGTADRFVFIEKFFGGASLTTRPETAGSKAGDFEPDAEAMARLENFLSKNPGAEQMIKQFLADRAEHSTKGKIKNYPEDTLGYLCEQFFYWPGLDAVLRDLDRDTLKKSGIPLVNPDKGFSTWDRPGVVVKLGTGYKLHYYEHRYCNKCKEVKDCPDYRDRKGSCYKCEKRNSKGGKTFPMPGAIDGSKPVILVEGEMNALSCAAIGVENLFAAGGTNGLTGPKVKAYLLDVPEIILFFDADAPGRKASGLDPLTESDRRKSNIPQTIRKAGYTGKIKLAELPPVSETGCKDQDALVLAGKRDVIQKAIAEAKEYRPDAADRDTNQKNRVPGTIWEAYDPISIELLETLLEKIERKNLDAGEIRPFVSACANACKHPTVKQKLLVWGATPEEAENTDGTSPYFLVEICDKKHGISKYLKKELEKALVPASELLKIIRTKEIGIKVDIEKYVDTEHVKQFITTQGNKSAAQVVHDVLDGNLIYLESKSKFYYFDGHVWQFAPNVTDMIYVILCSIIRYYMEHRMKPKGYLADMLVKIESRRFRVEIKQELSEYVDIRPEIQDETFSFDGAAIKETLTLEDGVMDFSGSEIVYRKSRKEEYRRARLEYTVDAVKNGAEPKKFMAFMKSNFKNEKTLESLLFYLSLLASRNTHFKYFGIFIGKTNTGKTMTINLLEKIYLNMIETIPAGVLVAKGRKVETGNEPTPYLAALEGKGAGIASETEKGGLLNNALIKLLTGGDKLTARALYEAQRTFYPTAQIILLTNYSPRFDAQDKATINRMAIIPFSISHNKGEEDFKSADDIINSLRPEYPSVVRLLAEYYIELKIEHDGDIPFSEECLNYKNNYVDEQRSDLDKFVNDNIEFGLGGEYFETTEDLYKRFLKYYDISEDSAEKDALPRKKFTYLLRRDYLEMKNYKQKKVKKFGKETPVPCFFNIRLKPWDEDADRPSPQGFFDRDAGKKTAREDREPETGQQQAEENPFD